MIVYQVKVFLQQTLIQIHTVIDNNSFIPVCDQLNTFYTELQIATQTDKKPPSIKQQSSWYTTGTRITLNKLATAELKLETSIYPFAAYSVQGLRKLELCCALTKYSVHAGLS